MGESQDNPFIDNPFMQSGKQTPPVEREPSPRSRRKTPKNLPLAPPEPPSEPPSTPKTASKTAQSKTAKAAKASKAIPTAAAAKTTTKARVSSKRKRTSPPAAAPLPTTTALGNNGYRVQVLAKIPMPSDRNLPSRDYLWFAVYPIIPRVGDCIFHDGRYFRVDAVFLYENTNVGWCADLEVSYYTRRH